jgi:uncharacterized protein (TIGR02145 family)
MKKILTIIAGIALLSGIATAQTDTMYIMKAGVVINKYNVSTQVDSIVFYKPGTITTPPNGTVTTGSATDYNGNSYKPVTLGTQTWFAENLKTTTYNDGTTIPNVTDGTAWAALTTGAQCDYDNTPANTTTYGKLYNWYAVNTGKLCPTGWHVPSDAEWTTLQTYLIANGYNYDGSTSGNYIAKSMASTTGWNSSTNTGAIGNTPSTNNTSGFTALPGGNRYFNGTFYDIGLNGSWWSSTEDDSSGADGRSLGYDDDHLSSYYDYEVSGFSVRCLRN